MGDVTLLDLDVIAAGQLQMYQTSNDADNQLERAMNDVLALTITADTVLTADQFTRNFTFAVSGNSSVYSLAVPKSKRFFSIENDGSASINVVRGTTSVSVGAGDSALLKTDGTDNGLKAYVGSTGTLGSAGGDLTGTYPDPAIAPTVVDNTKLSFMAAHSIKANLTGSSAAPTDSSVAAINTMLGTELTANKGVASGYASLDSGGKVPTIQLPDSVVGALEYQGTWNASTNTPSIVSSTGAKGNYYKVSVAGTTAIDGTATWHVGDWIVFNGTVWDKIDNYELVSSVNGHVGAVVLAVSDISGAAPAAGPTFTGTVTVPNNSALNDSTNAANTKYVDDAVAAAVAGGTGPTGSAGGDLTGSYPNPSIGAAVVSNTKLSFMAAHSIKANLTGSSAAPTDSSVAAINTMLGTELTANKGIANGYASLDSGGKVPTGQLPDSVVGALEYQGTWNANTNSPAIVSSTGTKGYYYKVSVAGATTIDSNAGWHAGDWIVFDGTVWDKVDNYELVSSVNGQVGVVVLGVSDISGAAPLFNPTFTGTVTIPNQSALDDSTTAANTKYVDDAVAAAVAGGSAPTGSAGGDLTDTYPSPTIATAKVTDTKANLYRKPPADRVTTANQSSLSGLPTIDGSAMTSGQVLLCTGQTTGSQNGPWAVASGSWTRPTWYAAANTAQAFQGALIDVRSGDFYTGSLWQLTTTGTITIDTTSTAWSGIGRRYDLAVFYPGVPSSSQLLLRYVATRTVSVGAGAPNSQLSAGTAATASTTLTIKKNGSSVGTIVVGISGTTGTFTVASAFSLVAGDVLTVTGPATADTTLADIAITLAAVA